MRENWYIIIIFSVIFVFFINKSNQQTDLNIKKKNAIEQNYLIESGFRKDVFNLNDIDESKKLCTLLSQQLGKPYKYGEEGPDSFDCSGLVKYIYSKLGHNLPRVAQDQASFGYAVKINDLRFGDIVFFSKDGKNITHTGIYIGNGYFVHAPQTGDVVKISTLNIGYYKEKFKKAARIIL